MIFIQPIDEVKNADHVYANTLRYHIDPEELVYVKWDFAIGVDSMYNEEKLDSFGLASEQAKKDRYDILVNKYFNPFHIAKYEVTNAEYREFVYWIRDSLFREAVYMSETITDEEAFSMLNLKKGCWYDEMNNMWHELDPKNRFINRAYASYKPDFNIWKEFKAEDIVPAISQYYLRPNSRYYKRRELDVSKLQYKYYKIETEGFPENPGNGRYITELAIPVYPDTLCWIKGFTYLKNDPMANMYFWHPAFDNYPVVGVSWTQAQAFCHWKTKQLENQYPDFMTHREVALPRTFEYEWAASQGRGFRENHVQDEQIITDLLLGLEDEEMGRFFKDSLSYHYLYMNKAHLPCDPHSNKCRKWIEKYIKDKGEHLITEEHKQLIRTRAYQNYLPSQVEFLSNNVSEWMEEDYQKNYAELIDAYMNYQCYANLEYCENQMKIDQAKLRRNNPEGKLIMGSNWYDERYETVLGVNTGGIYPKRFEHPDSSYNTVGFRYVIRLRPSYYSIHD